MKNTMIASALLASTFATQALAIVEGGCTEVRDPTRILLATAECLDDVVHDECNRVLI